MTAKNKKDVTEEELRILQIENRKNLALRRGHILNQMAELEHQLNIFLSNYFTRSSSTPVKRFAEGDNFEKWGQFYEFILGARGLSLNKKIELFSKIGCHKKEKFKHLFDDLDKILADLNRDRNFVAHGFIAYGTEPRMTNLGSHKFKDVDENFTIEFSKKCKKAYLNLAKLNDFLMGLKDF